MTDARFTYTIWLSLSWSEGCHSKSVYEEADGGKRTRVSLSIFRRKTSVNSGRNGSDVLKFWTPMPQPKKPLPNDNNVGFLTAWHTQI